jgi:hypothetical protein
MRIEMRDDILAVMPKERAAKKTAATKTAAAHAVEGPDPRFVPVAKAFAKTRGFSLMESKSGAMRGMMLDGKSFGMSSHGRLILKLDEERATALITEGIGQPFSPSPGRVMKGWIEITHAKADWIKLAKEAHELAVAVAAGGKKSGKKSAKAAKK